jgi:hypothetical protein
MIQLYLALLVVVIVFIRSLFWARLPVRHWYDFFPVEFKKSTRFCDFTDFQREPALEQVEALLQRPPMYASEEVLRPLLSACTVSTSSTSCVATRAVNVRVQGADLKCQMHEFVADDSAAWRTLFCTHEAAFSRPSLFTSAVRLFLVAPVTSYPLLTLKTLLPKRVSAYHFAQAKKIITLHKLLKGNSALFQAVSPTQTIWRWVVDGLLRIMVLKDKTVVKGALFFKKTMEVAGNKPVLDLVAGFYPKKNKEAKAALTNLLRNSHYVVRVHALGDLAALRLKVLKSETRHLYFYNHSAPFFEAADCFVL